MIPVRIEIKARIHHPAGLHARPLAQFVQTARQFKSTVQVRNLSNGKGPADGKSPLTLMLLTVQDGQEVGIEAEGEDSVEALRALEALIASNFEEG